MAKKKQFKRNKILKQLEQQTEPLQPTDPIAEAGRKVLQGEFIKMLSHEPGTRTGADIEDVHKMRVAIRQQRSLFSLLTDYYRPKVVSAYTDDLKHIMRALGAVRDLDVMIHDLGEYSTLLDAKAATTLSHVIDILDQQRISARDNLVQVLDSKAYRRFIKRYAKFLLTPATGVRAAKGAGVQPIEVRHVLPPMIHDYLANVRAYDSVVVAADIETLHALRIECKRLRYVVTLFSEVLGKEITEFINELRQIQDLLGRLHDIEVARQTLGTLVVDDAQTALLHTYIEQLEQETPTLQAQFPDRWKRFNTKTVQRKLANAILAL